MDPEFASIILGDGYVSMTVKNIESGDPMAVYKEKGAFSMFLGITLNNIYVAFLTFAFGAFYMIGAIAILVRNGVMVGTFQYFFVERDLFWESFLTIWIHGTLEISAIIIAGAAGLTMGRGLIFPGSYSRLQSFQQSAKRGLKIMIGIVPIIIMAGFFEGYLTRATETPDVIRGLFIAVCLLFVLGYYVWYPRMREKLGITDQFRRANIVRPHAHQIYMNRINRNSQIFTDTFQLYGQHFKSLVTTAIGISVLFFLLVVSLSRKNPSELFDFSRPITQVFADIDQITPFFSAENWRWIPILSILGISLFSWKVVRIIQHQHFKELNSKGIQNFLDGLKVLLVYATFVGLHYVIPSGYSFIIQFFYYLFLIWMFTMIIEQSNPILAIGRSLQLQQAHFFKPMGLWVILIIVNFLFFSLTDSVVSRFFLSLLEWVISFEQSVMDEISVIAVGMIIFVGTFLINGLFLVAMGITYFSLREITDASQLKEAVQSNWPTKTIKRISKGVMSKNANVMMQKYWLFQTRNIGLSSLPLGIILLFLVVNPFSLLAQAELPKGENTVNLSETKRKQLTEDLDYGEIQKQKKSIAPKVDRLPIRWAKIFLILTGLAILMIIIWQVLSNSAFFVATNQKNQAKLRIPTLEDAENQLNEVDLEPLINSALKDNDYKLAVRLYYLKSHEKTQSIPIH